VDLPEFLDRDRYGEIRLRGHRIGLDHIVFFHTRGESAAQIASRFPSLPPGLVAAVIAFYEANRDGVDAYVARGRAELDRQRAASAGPSLEELRRRKAGLASRES
jgi:uncharacterized protein (DUF433 family)